MEKCQENCTAMNFCKNGGNCSCDATCIITCSCGSAYKGSKCELGADTFAAVASPGMIKKKVNLKMTATNQNYMQEMQNKSSASYQDFVANFKNEIIPFLESVSPYFSELIILKLTNGSVNVDSQALYNYPSNKTLINYYEDSLVTNILNAINQSVSNGSVLVFKPLTEDSVTSNHTLTSDEILRYYTCNSSMEGYVVTWVDDTIQCSSPCSKPEACSNHGNCTHQTDGASCTCDSGYNAENLTCKFTNEGETTVSAVHTTPLPGSNAPTQLLPTTSTPTSKTSIVSKSTAGETTVSAVHTTPLPGSNAPTQLLPTTSTPTSKTSIVSKSTAGSCDMQKCQENCIARKFCHNDGTCLCDSSCTITDCNCGSAYTGSKCEHGADIVAADLRPDAPKVQFDMIVRFHPAGLNTSVQETMLRERFGNLTGFIDVSASQLNEGTTNESAVKVRFDYNNENINKIYNGGLKDDVKNKLRSQVRATIQENMTLIGEINQTNVPRENLDEVFQCNTSYEGYIVSYDSTGVFCKSPCNDTSYCSNHGTCSHLVSGPKCSCDPVDNMYEFSGDKCERSTIRTAVFHKILFGTLGGLLLATILGGIIFYLVKRHSRSQSHRLINDNSSASSDESRRGTFMDRRNIPSTGIYNLPETTVGPSPSKTSGNYPHYFQPNLEHVDTQKQVFFSRPKVPANVEAENE
uniref:mucin-17-like n=1 Tax=Myxine glutinosa TaxID=7769 RepID=UPI00358ECDCB